MSTRIFLEKVSQNGLEILGLLVDRMKTDFRPYVNAVLPHAVDRLGDARESVREKAHILLIKLMLATVSPQQLFDKLSPALAHKSAKVREEVMVLLQNALADHGAGAILLAPLVAPVVRLLSDPAAPVRDTAFNTLVELYKHVGERLRFDLQRKHSVPPARLPPLMAMFDQVRDSGLMKPTASVLPPGADGARRDANDEVDEAVAKTSVSRSTSAPPARRAVPQKAGGGAANGAAPTTNVRVRRTPSLVSRQSSATSSVSGTAAGAIDEATFIASFEQVPKVQLFSPRDLEDIMVKLRETISQQGNAWDVRTEALKKVRGVLIAGGTNFDELYQHLRLMEPALQLTLRDLR
ncbi:CLIP-associating protein 1-like isoform X2 [Pollicipes pollicipes]|uniref:CLIP-associating protein 1-like isoform X2 n=1 Tax=Pollicipes pollicipes TaxID=41117 RepID=UPI0018859718|nr:CLIP-associating protein 1-like isoform X2 [Pollicipes pollicipes]